MPQFFRPPTDNFHVYEDEPGTRIFSRIAAGPEGRNVYKLTDGTYTENQPVDTGDIEITYYGGHVIEVTAQEVSDLTAAGYGAFIS
jgi:hypothetical protein